MFLTAVAPGATVTLALALGKINTTVQAALELT